jgi:transcription initiation factor TFIID subunit 11
MYWIELKLQQIVNQTLSQSAPQSVILAVRSVAKIFIGEMIEGARRVQTQWQEVDEESKTLLPTPPTELGEEKVLRGPLLPDHLREAYRRHKLSGDDSLVGQLGLWQLQASSGVERFGNRCGGKRLFK